MKKVLQTLILLFVFYYLFQMILGFFSKGYEITYEIKNGDKTFIVKEIYSANKKNERDNYYFEIASGEDKYYLKTYKDFRKLKNIITDIKYVDTTDYKCILPIFKDGRLITDILCQNNYTTTYYYNLKGQNTELDNFASSIDEYDINRWVDNETTTTNRGNVYVYEGNLDNHLYLGLTSYKGLFNINYRLSHNVVNVNVFSNDVYDPMINTQVGQNYIVADYNSNYDFNQFYVIDLMSKESTTIKSTNRISHNSYFQGVVGNSAYLIDITNKKQYEIDIKTKNVIEVGNESLGVKYYNYDKWEQKEIYDAINNKLMFNYKNIDLTKFDKQYLLIDQIGSDKTGYYYLYENTSNGYNVYKAYVEQPNKPIYLFTTNNISNMIYMNDSVIYVDHNYIKIYNEEYGVKNLVRYDELEFNKSLKVFAHYSK